MRGPVAATLASQLAAAGLQGIDGGDACTRSSYLGEPPEMDAYHTLMDILRARLTAPPAPAEPWLAQAAGLGHNQSSYFRARAHWYTLQVAADPESMRPVEAIAPAQARRDALRDAWRQRAAWRER
mmetsp:Transcript_46003/g.144691  ORF Transcript_46003/g.144691 Transcript_46003/m.144691 type:complete len:126 (+) Transcript_46003:39-416(+)